jgi:2-keto-4-pentenoate hydratase/2-oxohepta-3-ene-1,7-dioic acid hydratase in catechol pathway
MKLVRCETSMGVFNGRLEGETVFPLENGPTKPPVPLTRVRLLAPTLPSKIVAVGLNYRDHAEELGMKIPDEPLLFLKPPSSVIGPADVICLPPASSRVDYEAELAVVIGRRASRVTRDKAGDHILGYTCLNDVTARDLQAKDGQWTRAKGFDTFCPIGPWIETSLDPADLSVELYLNGDRRQRSRTSQFVFPPDVLVAFISHVMTLEPGDVIATGTPSGIGSIAAGDVVEVRVDGIGSLVNTVVGGESCA